MDSAVYYGATAEQVRCGEQSLTIHALADDEKLVGLATHINGLNSLYLWAITLLVLVTAIVGKWGGAMLAARATGETWHAAASIGILMNTRGLTELVILSVGLELGVITTTMFTIMVIMALVTTLMATPLLALVSLERVSEGNVRAA